MATDSAVLQNVRVWKLLKHLAISTLLVGLLSGIALTMPKVTALMQINHTYYIPVLGKWYPFLMEVLIFFSSIGLVNASVAKQLSYRIGNALFLINVLFIAQANAHLTEFKNVGYITKYIFLSYGQNGLPVFALDISDVYFLTSLLLALGLLLAALHNRKRTNR